MKQKSSFPCLVAICQPLNAGTQAHWGVGQHTVWRWPGLAGVTGNYSGCSPLLYVCIIYVCIIRNRILPWPAPQSMSIHTAIHTSICIQSIHIHHRVQYQSILLSNGQKNELISLGTLKSDFSPLSTPFFWWRVIFFLSRNKHLGVCTYCIPSITFNSIHPINHQQLRPCRWQLVCLTSSDNSMILSHSGPLFFFFLFLSFSFFSVKFEPVLREMSHDPKGPKLVHTERPCNNTPTQ